MNLILSALGLGLAGTDVLGVFIVIAALSRKTPKRKIILFAVTVFVATVLLGVTLSLLLGASVNNIATFINSLPDLIWVIVSVFLIVVLWAWAILRAVRHCKHKDTTKKETAPKFYKYIKYGLFPVSIVFALLAITDPSFLALIGLAGYDGNILSIIAAFSVWILVSQASLFAFVIALLTNQGKKLEKWLNKFHEKYAQKISVALTAVIFCIGLLFLIDLIVFLTTNSWLFD